MAVLKQAKVREQVVCMPVNDHGGIQRLLSWLRPGDARGARTARSARRPHAARSAPGAKLRAACPAPARQVYDPSLAHKTLGAARLADSDSMVGETVAASSAADDGRALPAAPGGAACTSASRALLVELVRRPACARHSQAWRQLPPPLCSRGCTTHEPESLAPQHVPRH